MSTGSWGLPQPLGRSESVKYPPGEYGRKAETQGIDGAHTSGGGCGLIRGYAKNLSWS